MAIDSGRVLPWLRAWTGTRVFSVGHSTRSMEEFLELLRAFGVDTLADIRTVPRSGHNPQFDFGALRRDLPAVGFSYVHVPGLGGLRHARKDSDNTAWRNDAFRGYADYMQTEPFETALEELRQLAMRGRVAMMCAEAVPWRCHRSLVADAVLARGGEVVHVMGAGRASPHRLTPFARVEDGRVTYPGADVTAAPEAAPP